jgi:flagellar export protein FliJ
MAFKFTLATLLRLREIAEQREERLLGQIQNQIAHNRQTLTDLATQRKDVIERREVALTEAVSGVDILDSYARVKAIESLEESGREQLEKLLALRDQQMKVYQSAHRDSEVLTEMRVEQKEDFYKERTKQEQSAMDDNFSSRRSFK